MTDLRKNLVLCFSFILVVPFIILILGAVMGGYEDSTLKKIIN